MREKIGFTFVEIITVVAILGVLLGVAMYFYSKYELNTIKTALISDIRHCVYDIFVNDTNATQTVSKCQKSGVTKNIILVSEKPLVLKAVSSKGSVTCVYDTNTASLNCNSTF